MEIKNTTKLTSKEFCYMMQAANARISPILTLIGCILLGALTLILLVLDVLEFEWMNFYYVLICAVVFGIILFLHIYPKTLSKMIIKQNSDIQNGITYEYSFRDDHFEASAITDRQNTAAKINYASLYKVKYKKDFMILYISKSQVYLCKYDGFKGDDKNKFFDILSLYMSKKRI